MQFINDSTGFVVGSNVNASCDVSYTTDYGQTWNSIIFPYDYAGYGVYAFDTANVFMAGSNQTIISTGVGAVVTSNKKIASINEQAYKIYPNPSNGIFNIESPIFAESEIEVYDVASNMIYKNNLTNKLTQLDLTKFSSGLYFLKITSGNKYFTCKISKY
jgi:hypothetical protein